MKLTIFLLCIAFALVCSVAAAEPKKRASAPITDDQKLDRLERLFVSTPQFGKEFTRASITLADERGPEIIRAIMARSHRWRGEEVLVFVTVVDVLPREPALKTLRPYQHSKVEAERTASSDFITEFGMSGKDQSAIRKYAATK